MKTTIFPLHSSSVLNVKLHVTFLTGTEALAGIHRLLKLFLGDVDSNLSRFHSVYAYLNERESVPLNPDWDMEREEVPQAPEQGFSCSPQRSMVEQIFTLQPVEDTTDSSASLTFPWLYSHTWIAVRYQTSVSTHHNTYWLYFFSDYIIQFFHILSSFSLVEKIRNTGILYSHRRF